MRKIFIVIAAFVLAACSNSDTDENPGPGGRDIPRDRSVRIFAAPVESAGIAPLSILQDGLNLSWEKGDKIGVFMHDDTGICSDVYTAEDVGRVTGKTEFMGTLTFEENGLEHTFYAYYPQTGDAAAEEPTAVPVTVPDIQTQQGTTTNHLAGLNLLAAEPVRATAPEDKTAAAPDVNLRFHPVLALVEVRLAAYKVMDMEAQTVSILASEGSPALAVSGATMDVTKPYGSGFAAISGGMVSSTVTLTVDGGAMLPKSQTLTFPGDQEPTADPSTVFSAYLAVCPGDFSGRELTFRITTSKGLFSFTVPGPKLECGKKYIAAFVLGEEEPDDSIWDGTAEEPAAMDHAAKTISIANGRELAWLANAVNGTITENVPDATFAGYEVALTADIDLGGAVGWTPIGKSAGTPFCGNFHGAGHMVSNIKFLTGSDCNVAGLFGHVNGLGAGELGLIEGVTVRAFNAEQQLDGILYFGGVCALAANVEFRDCAADVQVKDAAVQKVCYGGIVGQANNMMVVSGCSTDGTVVVGGGANTGGMIGGIVGNMQDGAEGASISDCRSNMSFIAAPGAVIIGGICGQAKAPIFSSLFSGSIDGAADTGGICGMVGHPNVVITGCCNTGSIRGIRAGGITGQVKKGNYKVGIVACYNTGAISGTVEVSGSTTNSYAAGILAWHRGTMVGSVSACYNAGKIVGEGKVGSIYANKGSAVVSASFATEKGAVDGSDAGVLLFGSSEPNWPAETDANWGVVDGVAVPEEGRYWKPYIRFTMTYPRLWWEADN